MTRAGYVTSTYRDLGGTGSLEVSDRRQRYACGACGRTVSGRPGGLLAGFRLTERLADAVAAACLDDTQAAAAARYGLAETTVRDVVSAQGKATLAEVDGRVPDLPAGACLLLSGGGPVRPVVARSVADGTVANAFEGPGDPRLRAWFSGLPPGTRSHVDMETAMALGASRAGVTLHRVAALQEVGGRMGRCLKRLARSVEGRTRRALREAAGLLLRDRWALRPSEVAALEAGCRDHPLLGAFRDCRAGALAVFATPDRSQAEAALRSWRAALAGRLAEAFEPVAEWFATWAPVVLTAGYGAVPAPVWHRMAAPVTMPGDTSRRAVLRLAAGVLARRQELAYAAVR